MAPRRSRSKSLVAALEKRSKWSAKGCLHVQVRAGGRVLLELLIVRRGAAERPRIVPRRILVDVRDHLADPVPIVPRHTVPVAVHPRGHRCIPSGPRRRNGVRRGLRRASAGCVACEPENGKAPPMNPHTSVLGSIYPPTCQKMASPSGPGWPLPVQLITTSESAPPRQDGSAEETCSVSRSYHGIGGAHNGNEALEGGGLGRSRRTRESAYAEGENSAKCKFPANRHARRREARAAGRPAAGCGLTCHPAVQRASSPAFSFCSRCSNETPPSPTPDEAPKPRLHTATQAPPALLCGDRQEAGPTRRRQRSSGPEHWQALASTAPASVGAAFGLSMPFSSSGSESGGRKEVLTPGNLQPGASGIPICI